MIIENLENQLLVAMPKLHDPNFFQSVVYLCEHNANGAIGIIINIPLQIKFNDVLQHLKITVEKASEQDIPILMGGPVGKDQGFIIYTDAAEFAVNEKIKIGVSSSKKMLLELSNGDGPKHALIALGFASWGGGQLEQELANNYWIIAPADPRLIFSTPFEQRWRKAAALVGVDFHRLSWDVGHG